MRFLLIIMMLSVSSCKYNVTFKQIKSLVDLKQDVEDLSSEDLTKDAHVKLKDYFSNIKDISFSFLNSPNMKRYTRKYFSKYFDDSLCEDALVGYTYYTKIMNKCSVNGFYICSEEVRAYVTILKAVKSELTSIQLNKIMSSKICREKLLNLGVVNE